MVHLLYEQVESAGELQLVSPTRLVGLLDLLRDEKADAGAWHVTPGQLADRFQNRMLVFDVKPGESHDATIVILRQAWGWSYPNYAPVAFHLQTIVVDSTVHRTVQVPGVKSPPEYKAPARLRIPRNADAIVEFAYLKATSNSTWNWGRTGYLNAALLWRDAHAYFQSEFAANGIPMGASQPPR